MSKGNSQSWTERSDAEPQQEPRNKKRRRRGRIEAPSQNNAHHPPQKGRRGPSQEALQLSEKLKDLSRKKFLDAALEEYSHKRNDDIRDGHHACILIDCCSRCGDMSAAEQLVQELSKNHKPVNVETNTALLKGYAHSGDMIKAEALFLGMCSSEGKAGLPNVRTLNTILRGCLWTAVTIHESGTLLCGGIATMEKSWNAYLAAHETKERHEILDVSSYEYSICILCQALRVEEADARLKELERHFQSEEDYSVLESLALSHHALARAYGLLGKISLGLAACTQSLEYASASKVLLRKGTTLDTLDSKEQPKTAKRSWKASRTEDTRREQSNTAYREHRLSEMEMETNALHVIYSGAREKKADFRHLARRILTRLIVMTGGGTTTRDSTKGILSCSSAEQSRGFQRQFVNSTFFSFGLKQILDETNKDTSWLEDLSKHNTLRSNDCNRILGSLGLQGGILTKDGFVDFDRIFMAGVTLGKKRKMKAQKKRKLAIELGSGFGEWVAIQAKNDKDCDYVSVELRADRVGQTFARIAACSWQDDPIDNLCIVGAESGSFLQNLVMEETAHRIFVNHPEPPTQTFGGDDGIISLTADGGKEAGHMLNSSVIAAAMTRLSKDGRLVIVTDNKLYGRLICATIVRVSKAKPGLIHPVDLSSEDPTFEMVESFKGEFTAAESICLYEGQPNATIGHPSMETTDPSGNTYFDRLWRQGVSHHADKYRRFIVVVSRPQPVP